MHPVILAGFCAMRGLAAEEEHPPRASRPFDALRSGFVMGEGACVLVLEELEAARKRGATVYAEILGYGASNDAYHLAQPEPEATGVAEMMRQALARANVEPERVGYINAHGTSTPLGDAAETKAIKDVFGEHAYELAVSSTKSVMGHCFGAAGAIEAMMCVLAIHEGVLPPTINYEHPGPRVRSRLRAERGAPRPKSTWRCRMRWASAATTPACSSGASSYSTKAASFHSPSRPLSSCAPRSSKRQVRGGRERPRELRDEDLVAVGGGHDAGRFVHGHAAYVVADELDLTDVHSCSDVKVVSIGASAYGRSAVQCTRRPVERRDDAVTRRRHLAPLEPVELGTNAFEVRGEKLPPARVTDSTGDLAWSPRDP